MLTVLFIFMLSLMVVIKILIQGIYLIHKLQLLGYDNSKFIKWVQGDKYRTILVWNLFELLLPLLIITVLYFFLPGIKIYKFIVSSLMVLVFLWKIVHPFISGWIGPKAHHKKHLVYTKRVKRLIITLVLTVALTFAVIYPMTIMPLDKFALSAMGFLKFNAFILLFSVITPMFILLANIINLPVEKTVHLFYFLKAKFKIKNSNIKPIGITGSFGKTSTKFFLHTILNEKYKTLTTPSSYNTPMGISKIINTTDLGEYEYFSAEMGADKKGDIAELCRLVSPAHGIITAIGEQHLETFYTLDNIIKTKLALFKSLGENSFAVYNFDDKNIQKGISITDIKAKLYSYSVNPENFDKVDVYGDNIRYTREALTFDMTFKTGEKISVSTNLLGTHNVKNLLASALMAKLVGLGVSEIFEAIKKIQPVEHRLQKIDAGTGVLVLDDAFNSNIEGAKEAVSVLKAIEGNKKVIVTPGFVEMGELEESHNRIFGEHIGENVDKVILIGKKRTLPIYEGIIKSGMSQNEIHIVNSLTEAQSVLGNILSKGDIVLFENDLPDVYDE